MLLCLFYLSTSGCHVVGWYGAVLPLLFECKKILLDLFLCLCWCLLICVLSFSLCLHGSSQDFVFYVLHNNNNYCCSGYLTSRLCRYLGAGFLRNTLWRSAFQVATFLSVPIQPWVPLAIADPVQGDWWLNLTCQQACSFWSCGIARGLSWKLQPTS